jgi:chromate transporter
MNAVSKIAQPRVPPWALFQIWLCIGASSFGGGVATQFLIHKSFVQQRGWLSDDEFLRMFAICQIAPGINLFGLAILIGQKLMGGLGVALSLLGFVLPSASITILMTALYAHFKDSPEMRAALRGITPAIVAMGVVLSWKLVRPVLLANEKRRLFPRAIGLVLMALCAAAILLFNIAPFAVYLLAGAFGAFAAFTFHKT